MKKFLALFLMLPLLAGCGLSQHEVGRMALISDVTETSNRVIIDNMKFDKGSREGKACATNILGIIATGDMSVETAKKNGNITTITSVTEKISNKFLMSEICTVVRGY